MRAPHRARNQKQRNKEKQTVKKTTIIMLALLLLTPAAFAQQKQKTLKYLTAAEIDPSHLLPPPPKDGTEAQKQELADLKRLLAARTTERFKQAQWDDQHESSIVFASAIGPEFDLTKLPATAKLLADVENDQSVAASAAKQYFHRTFAAVIDTSIVELNCDPAAVKAGAAKPGGRALRSYPSGHATMGYSVGVVLAALIPEKSQAILARAADYSYSREVCGEHYHSDVEASHALGNSIGIMLLNNAALKPQIEAAQAELRAARIVTE
jgi:acid phosphatase (class A)